MNPVNLSTTYMGLTLPSPVIVGSSGLTQSVMGIEQCAKAGAGAVVLKSLFEEQILAEVAQSVQDAGDSSWHPEAAEYLAAYGREHAVADYLKLIQSARKAVNIPIIASVHCVDAEGWVDFAARAERAGASALELNVFLLPNNPRLDSETYERAYFDILNRVKKQVRIPVSLKLGWYFSSLARMAERLGKAGADALVLFNRFVRLDFDIETLEVVSGGWMSHPEETLLPLRWISLLYGRVQADLAATTGIHDGAAVIKHILAGAKAVQVVSALHQHHLEYLETMLADVRTWMDRKGFASVHEFRGRLAQRAVDDTSSHERVQFMKVSVGLERPELADPRAPRVP